MAKLSRFQTSFEFGEISPRLLARIDLNAYAKSTKTMENAYSLIHGGAQKRPGTLFIDAVRTESQQVRLIPFVFDEATRFLLVLNGGYVQFVLDGQFVETSPGVRYQLAIPYTADEVPFVQYSQSGSAMYLVHPNHKPKILQRYSDTSWSFSDIPFTYNAISDATYSNAYITFKIINGSDYFQEGERFEITTVGGAISTITGPLNDLESVMDVNTATSGENIQLSGNGHPTNTDFKLDGRLLATGDRVLVKDQTLKKDNGIYIVNTAGAWTRATDSNTAAKLNAKYVRVRGGDINFESYWKQTATVTTLGTDDVVYEEFSAPGNGRIAGVTSMPGSTTTETWTIECIESAPSRQLWSVVGSVSGEPVSYWKPNNYPQTVSFFEQRLFFGGSPQFPQHIWGSAAGDYFNFSVGTRDSDAVIVQIAGNDYNALTHLVSARNLLPLTTSTEFSIAGPNSSAISGLSSNIVKDHTRNGSNFVRPMRIGREVIFLQRDGKKARAISYSVTEDNNVAPDISIFAEHLTRDSSFVDMAFASNPDYIGWIVRGDGQLMSLTLAREFETTAWARHVTDGEFEAVATLPGTYADDVYVCVKRTVGGVTHRYIELFDYDANLSSRVYSDSTEIYEGVATTTITGLNHLEGKTVTALVKEDSAQEIGVVHPNRVVVGGSITFEYPVEYAAIGLPYTTTLELLDPEFGDSTQPSSGKAKSVVDIVVRFQETVNAKINGVVIPFRNVGALFNEPIPAYTGDKRVKTLGWRSPDNIVLTSDTPTPFSVLGVIIEAAVN